MAVFRRRELSPGPFRQYTQYRPYVREDFAEGCAYCLLPEIILGGEENFELDHFRPRSLPQFIHLSNDFYNLYYACHVCNKMKGDYWPAPFQESQSWGFVDLCLDPFTDHFQELADGRWLPLSRRAEYTLDKLRLNRNHLVKIRRLLRRIAEELSLPRLDLDIPLGPQIRPLLESFF